MSFRTAIALSILMISCVGCRAPKAPTFLTRMFDRNAGAETNAPPRKKVADADAVGKAGVAGIGPQFDSSEVQLTEFSDRDEPIELVGATVVAEVNSVPIFADDVLKQSRFREDLKKAEGRVSPKELNVLRGKIIQSELPQHIEKAVLVSALQNDLEPEQLEQLEAQMDALFEREVERLKTQFGVGTRVELERLLEQNGSSLSQFRGAFAAREMAMFYIGEKTKGQKRYSRKELREWYTANKDQFRIEPKVRWQQIRINNGAEAAEKKSQVVTALRAREDFGEVATRFSDGPKKDEGGLWDWTTQGTLADEKVERALFELEIGQISAPLQTDTALVLVKVIEREDGGYVPFDDVQNKINNKLLTDSRQKSAEKLIRDLMADADIRTVFDGQKSKTE